jgi:hypothetical protein
MTYEGSKMSLDVFLDLLSEETFYNKIRSDIITKINEDDDKPKMIVEDDSSDQETAP